MSRLFWKRRKDYVPIDQTLIEMTEVEVVDNASSVIKQQAPLKTYHEWYWRFIPHYRHVEDFHAEIDSIDNSSLLDVESSQSSDAVTPEKYEFRDEANRKWWKFFDEYEYRVTTEVRQKKVWWRWYDEGTSAAEKKLIAKLDLLMVTFAIISYWSKNLDQANVANAYVSGMKEGINMKGDDYSNTVAMYNAGSVIFQAFYMYLFPRVPMHLIFFFGDIGWSMVTICTSAINNVSQLHACRFLIGATEAGYFMAIHYLLGSWYKPWELGRRGGLYYCGQMLGTLTSGLVSAQIYESMDGHAGRAGWRWIFLIDGCITMPVGLLALYMVPGTPENCCSLFLTDDDIRLARKRLKEAKIVTPSRDPPPFLNWKLWKQILTSWPIYVLSILDGLFWNSSYTGGNGFALWLKSLDRYSTGRINRFTSIPPALGVFFIIAVCFSADIMGSRTYAIFWAECFNFSGAVALAIWTKSETSKWYAFFVSYFGITISSVVYGWLNDIMRHDPQARAIVLCWCNMFANQSTAWIARLTYPTSEAPRYKRGYTYTASVDAVLMVWVWITMIFYKRQEKKDAKKNGIILYNSKTGDIPPEIAGWVEENGKVKTKSNNESSSETNDVAKDNVGVKVKRLSDSE